MCVPECALRYYEEELERDYIARENGFDNYEDYYNSLQDDAENAAYDNWKDNQLTGEA